MIASSDHEMPLVTVGIACFNAESTVVRAVRSAQSQTWPNLEIVVVDDCSTDGSWAVLQRLHEDDPRIRIQQSETNQGVGATRNAILEQARGVFVAFFDDDDESVPDRVRRQWAEIVSYEERSGVSLVISHAARLQILPDGQERYEPTFLAQEGHPVPFGCQVADMILIGRPSGAATASMATCSQMARVSVYQSVGGFDASLRRSEDTDLNVRLALSGAHFVGVADPLVRQHITVSGDKGIGEERRFALDWLGRHKDYLSEIGWWGHAQAWLNIKYDYLSGHKMRGVLRFFALGCRAPLKTWRRLMWTLPNRHHSKSTADLYKNFHSETGEAS